MKFFNQFVIGILLLAAIFFIITYEPINSNLPEVRNALLVELNHLVSDTEHMGRWSERRVIDRAWLSVSQSFSGNVKQNNSMQVLTKILESRNWISLKNGDEELIGFFCKDVYLAKLYESRREFDVDVVLVVKSNSRQQCKKA